jgi:pimeloyl-ACP methyl ester carboxylesterase
MVIVFAHGLEGSPEGAKIQALRQAGLSVVAPDGRGRPLAERIALLEAATRDGSFVLGGSSYGGLAAAWLAAAHPDRFVGLVLCAPALHWSEPPVVDVAALTAPPGLPTVILHGLRDDVVPIDVSRRYRDRSGPHVELLEVDDDHRLHGTLDQIVAAVSRLSR